MKYTPKYLGHTAGIGGFIILGNLLDPDYSNCIGKMDSFGPKMNWDLSGATFSFTSEWPIKAIKSDLAQHMAFRFDNFGPVGDYVRTPTGLRGTPVEENKAYFVEAFAAGSAEVAVNYNVRWYDAAGTYLSSSLAQAFTLPLVSNSSLHVGGSVTAPASAAYASLEFASNEASITTQLYIATLSIVPEERWGGTDGSYIIVRQWGMESTAAATATLSLYSRRSWTNRLNAFGLKSNGSGGTSPNKLAINPYSLTDLATIANPGDILSSDISVSSFHGIEVTP